MARYTSAYSSFLVSLKEVDLLRNSAAQKERVRPIVDRHQINALCRGAIVLLSSHLEAFVRNLGELALDNMYSKRVPRDLLSDRIYLNISKDIIEEIKDTKDHDGLASKMFAFMEKDAAFWSKIGPFQEPIDASRFNKGFSSPAFKKVCAYFNRFGYDEYKHDMKVLLAARYSAVINMVDHLVNIRNNIAHGDPTVTKTPSEVLDMIDIIRTFCNSTDRVFANWCSTQICKIR